MINSVVLMGRLTADPDLRTTQSGIPVVRFGLAIDRDYVRQGEDRQTDFVNVVAWRNTAEFISRYFRKGAMIAIQGALRSHKYKTAKGETRTAYDVEATYASFTGAKNPGGVPEGQKITDEADAPDVAADVDFVY